MLRIALAFVVVAACPGALRAQSLSRCAGLEGDAEPEGAWFPYLHGVAAAESELVLCDGETERVALRIEVGARVLVQTFDPRTGRVAILVRHADDTAALWLLSAAGEGAISCSDPPAPFSAIDSRWSPAGTLVLHFSSGSATSETFVCHPDGTRGWISGAARTSVSPNAAFVAAYTPVVSPAVSSRFIVYSVESERPVASLPAPVRINALTWGRGEVRVGTRAREHVLRLPRRWP